jgi:Fe2+ transport system protein FeoA
MFASIDRTKEGTRVRVSRIESAAPLARRLADLGISPSEDVTVVKNDGVNPVVISVRGTCIAFGRSIASSIVGESEEIA